MQAEVVPGILVLEAGWMKGYVQNGDWSRGPGCEQPLDL